MKKAFSTSTPVKRPRRRIGEMPVQLYKELKSMSKAEATRLRIAAAMQALNYSRYE